MSKRGKQPEKLEEDLLDLFKVNTIGNIHLFNLITPLVLKGRAKKVIAISTGFTDKELIAKFEIHNSAPYAISKAALELAVASFSAQYSKDGVLFMAISPGVVDTGNAKDGKIHYQVCPATYYMSNSDIYSNG